jgi:hypothetical protein
MAAAAAGSGFADDAPIIHAENLVNNIKSINYRFLSSSSSLINFGLSTLIWSLAMSRFSFTSIPILAI